MPKTDPNYENTIRSSNTVFSTMICPECGKRLVFEGHGSYVTAYCPTKKHYSTDITVIELCGIINHNGLNSLITPYVPLKNVGVKTNDDSLEEPEPPDGFKIEPVEKE